MNHREKFSHSLEFKYQNANQPSIVPVIIAGGSGTRLWPLSRAKHPKQFISLTDNETMFQKPLEDLRN